MIDRSLELEKQIGQPPSGLNQEISITGGAGLPGTEYSMLHTTDMSEKLDELFGLGRNLYPMYLEHSRRLKDGSLKIGKIDDPKFYIHMEDILAVSQTPSLGLTGEITISIPEKVARNIRGARCFMLACCESKRIVDFFSELAMKVGFFFALSCDEVVKVNRITTRYRISRYDISEAVKEGYARVGTIPGEKPATLLEVTDKFCPLRLESWQEEEIRNFLPLFSQRK